MSWQSRCARSAFVLLASILAGGFANSQSSPTSEKDLQTALATGYVSAKQSHDIAKLLSLLHPKVRACINDSNRDYFNYLLTQDSSSFPKGKIQKISITPVASDALPMVQNFFPAEMFPYPVKPTHNAQLDVEIPSEGNTFNAFTALLELAPEKGAWYWVTACPTDKGLQFVRAGMERAAQAKAEASKLASEIKEPLRSELKSLLAAGKKIDAIKKYQAATNADLTTAHRVIEALGDSSQK